MQLSAKNNAKYVITTSKIHPSGGQYELLIQSSKAPGCQINFNTQYKS